MGADILDDMRAVAAFFARAWNSERVGSHALDRRQAVCVSGQALDECQGYRNGRAYHCPRAREADLREDSWSADCDSDKCAEVSRQEQCPPYSQPLMCTRKAPDGRKKRNSKCLSRGARAHGSLTERVGKAPCNAMRALQWLVTALQAVRF